MFNDGNPVGPISDDMKKVINRFEKAVVERAHFPMAKSSNYKYNEAKKSLLEYVSELECNLGFHRKTDG